jgi:hypothetical protein
MNHKILILNDLTEWIRFKIFKRKKMFSARQE